MSHILRGHCNDIITLLGLYYTKRCTFLPYCALLPNSQLRVPSAEQRCLLGVRAIQCWENALLGLRRPETPTLRNSRKTERTEQLTTLRSSVQNRSTPTSLKAQRIMSDSASSAPKVLVLHGYVAH